MPDRLYLDHAATTPVVPAARAAFAHGLALWANPSSPHHEGRAARAALESARSRVRAALDWPHEVIFTSGATEAIAIALDRAAVALSAVEHAAVIRAAGERAIRLEVGADGIVADHVLNARLGTERGKQPIAAIQSVNSESGIMQPLGHQGAIVRSRGAILMVDASQSAGKLPLPDADLIVVSGHKLGAPPGIGALLVRDLALLTVRGGQEQGYRPGTENLPGAMALAAALEQPRDWVTRATSLRNMLDDAIVADGGVIVGQHTPRLATIASYRMPGVSAAAQVIQFDRAGIGISAGSACSSGSLRPSAMLQELAWPAAMANEVIRVSLGPETGPADIARFMAAWSHIAATARARAA